MSSAYRAALAFGSAACVTVGAGLLALAVTLWAQNRPLPADFGRLPATTRSAPAATTSATGATMVTTATSATTRAPGPPRVVAIPAIGVRASVVAVHAVDGVLGVPGDPRELGWWADGAPVGAATGSVVIDGHVDSAVSGEGALFGLTRLQAGDAVLVTTRGQTVRFVVTARRRYLKTDGLPPDLFRTDGPPRLVLITCGGPFDRSAHSYLDNIVVFASPLT